MPFVLLAVHIILLLIIAGNAVYLRRLRRRPLAEPPARLTVLIPARNEEDNLRRLLPSLTTQDHPNFEVIVYDDGSEDETWAVIQAAGDARIRGVRGEGPPPGWVGKVHALYQATRHADGDRYLFLDADAELRDAGALRRLAERHAGLPGKAVLTGFTRLCGGGLLLVSLVPSAILSGLPWPLAVRSRLPALGALNGQCWLIDADLYHRYEPHDRLRDRVLEDVEIGRYLKGQGLHTYLVDVQRELNIFMYRDLADAWRGFRKNAYLILGGTPWSFAVLYAYFVLTYVLAPFFAPWLVVSLYLVKAATDRLSGFPLWVTLLTPLSFFLGALLQLDSAIAHLTGRVSWKGRRV